MELMPSKGLRDFWALVHAYWWSEEKIAARLLLFAIVALTLGMVYMNVQINAWQNQFFNSLQDKDPARFYHQLLRFVGLAAAWVVMSVYSQYLTQMLQVRWRRWLTDDYIRQWLADRVYYRMQFAARTDNPDQRIAEDLRLFADGSVSLFIGLLNAGVTLVSFVGILWMLSGPFILDIGTRQLVIPGYMVWVAVIYALAGDWVAHLIGKALIALNFRQQGTEADFRYSLVRFRDNMEGVALYHGEEDELIGFRSRYADVFSAWRGVIRRQRKLAWFTSSYAQAAVVVPFLVAAPRFFSGALPLGGLMQTAGAFGYVRESLTWFVNAYVAFANWKAALDRLTTFRNDVDTARAEQQSNNGVERVVDGAGGNLELTDIELDRPGGAPLVSVERLSVAPGSRVLIRGPSGSGKSTLLRAIAGIWPFGRGSIRLPRAFDALFLPQRAYFPLGTLREAMCYPTPCHLFADTVVKDALRSVGLTHLVPRLDEAGNWSLALSGADQQRVAFARALLQRPTWLFLDEATSNLDDSSQAALCKLLADRLPETAMVSIASRQQLAAHHEEQWELRSTTRGTHELLPLNLHPTSPT